MHAWYCQSGIARTARVASEKSVDKKDVRTILYKHMPAHICQEPGLAVRMMVAWGVLSPAYPCLPPAALPPSPPCGGGLSASQRPSLQTPAPPHQAAPPPQA